MDTAIHPCDAPPGGQPGAPAALARERHSPRMTDGTESIAELTLRAEESGLIVPSSALEHAPRHAGGRQGTADVHMHTNYSDGIGSVEEVLAFVQDHTSLDVIAITDHDTIEGALRARDLVAKGGYRFEVIVGEEISTREGHMLALFLEKPVAPDQSIERSIELVRSEEHTS